MDTTSPRPPGADRALPLPPARDLDAIRAFVATHLGHLSAERPSGPDEVRVSGRFRGGQVAADAALASLDLAGYAGDRNEVWPPERRGASAMSPYVRHGLVDLPTLWDAAGDAPATDRRTYRDELLWQEYARHWYARLGTSTREGVRHALPVAGSTADVDPWDRAMACMDLTVGELEGDGWLVNQTRMWLASQWSVRHGVAWQDGEDRFFRHLLDGSRAANRLGWQWTVGAGSSKLYGFSRWQVEKRGPGVCDGCALRRDCPIEDWPEDPTLTLVEEPPALRRDEAVAATAGPREPVVDAEPEAVWLTAESLGDADPALDGHPDLPVVFVFDAALLERLRLSTTRLVFLTECLVDLAERRDVEVHLGDPVEVLAGRPLATTFAPVPGWRRRSAALDVVATHPWRWLVPPHGRSLASFTAWRKAAEKAGTLPR